MENTYYGKSYSTAEVKALSDYCCTSANAVSVVRHIENDKILFTPDRNLGNWVCKQVPEKQIAVYDGACPTHDVLRGASVKRTKERCPEAILIAHPECEDAVLALAKPGKVTTEEYPGNDPSWSLEWDDFMRALGGAPLQHGSVQDGLVAMRMIDALYCSARGGTLVTI